MSLLSSLPWTPCSAPATLASFPSPQRGVSGWASPCWGQNLKWGSETAHQGSSATQQNTEHSCPKVPLTSYECNKSRQRTTGKSGRHPQLICWESQGNKARSRKRGERGSLGTHDPDSCRKWGPTQPPDPAPEVTVGHSRRGPHPQTL